MDDSIRQILGENTSYTNAIADIGFFELEFGIRCDWCERGEISGIGKLIKRDDLVAKIQDEMPANGGTNEPSLACHKNSHCSELPLFVVKSFFDLCKPRIRAIFVCQNEVGRRKPPVDAEVR